MASSTGQYTSRIAGCPRSSYSRRVPLLGQRFQDALQFASALHATQLRKGTAIPYVSHLLSACALVLESGGSEDEAIAALLHDAVEDQGGPPVLAEIERRFGPGVAAIVAGCTDSDTEVKPPWRPRKEAYIAHLREAPLSVQRVSAADKLHNARSIVADLHRIGGALFSRFTGGREGTLWYYETLATVFSESEVGPLAEELRRTVDEMKRLAG
jgi:(p)ppGpp synthase/HD superfamily hydrolase